MKRFTDQSRMPFGVHKDAPMEKVPAHYLLFLWEDCRFHDINDLKALAERPRQSEKQLANSENRLAVALYIKDNFAGIEKEAPNRIIDHRPQ